MPTRASREHHLARLIDLCEVLGVATGIWVGNACPESPCLPNGICVRIRGDPEQGSSLVLVHLRPSAVIDPLR